MEKKGRRFTPDYRVFVLLGNADYGNRRKDEGYAGFCDLPAVYNDLDNMRQGLKDKLGAQDSEITELRDADFARISATLQSTNERIILNWAQGKKKTLVLVYYAGHGVMKNFTNIVCNDARRPHNIFYPLEK